MKTQQRQCKECQKFFDALVSAVLQGKGNYCSRRCSITNRKSKLDRVIKARFKKNILPVVSN